MARPSLLVFAYWCVLALTGCDGSESFLCLDHAECGDEGVCEDNGSCSFADASCESGRRYGEFASDRIAGACVGPESEPEPQSIPSPESTTDMPASGVCAQEESCELCLACTVVEAPCAQHVLTCATNDACLDGLNCAQACLMLGDCGECCADVSPEEQGRVQTLGECQVSECGALCGENRVPECSPA